MKLLLVEDHQELADNIINFLKQENYICEWVSSLAEAKDILSMFEYDCVLLDMTLPDGTGLTLLHYIKQLYPSTQVIIISAQNSLDYKIIGLDSGADDYITKPFPLPELHSRIKAVARRSKKESNNDLLIYNEIVIDMQSMECKVKDILLNLTKKELNLLIYFINNKNRVLSRQAIAIHLWGDYTYNLDNVDFIYQHLKNLRRKISEADGTDYVQTVYGLGYKWTDG
ncbi:response regulator transcription factor [Empedobacter brevis]|uniref:response regulator transcription factor n=1 Tax=Empedobacter brevis TaxID=247 RepID=UPI0028A11C6B|nr:response regulator transcription factor [Empedobacter brevis]